MADTSDYIPASAIRFDDAFERLFDADPRAAELKAKIDRLVEAIEGGVNSDEYANVMDEWEVARTDVDIFFRNELRYGPLSAYQRDPYTGQELRVTPEDWEAPAILVGADLTFPPIYFVKSEFQAWLRKVRGKKREKPSYRLELAKRALREEFGDTIPEDKTDPQLYEVVRNWCRRHPEIKEKEWPGPDSVRRAAGRRP
jgi:hypothetical protein